KDPAYNEQAARAVVADLEKRFPGDKEAQLVAYNAGPGRARDWIASGRDVKTLPTETQGYLSRANLAKPAAAPSAPAGIPPPPPGFKIDQPKLGLGQALKETGSQLYDIFVDPVVKGAISGGKKVTGQDTSGIGQNLTDEELMATMTLGGMKAPGGKPTMLPKGAEVPKPAESRIVS